MISGSIPRGDCTRPDQCDDPRWCEANEACAANAKAEVSRLAASLEASERNAVVDIAALKAERDRLAGELEAATKRENVTQSVADKWREHAVRLQDERDAERSRCAQLEAQLEGARGALEAEKAERIDYRRRLEDHSVARADAEAALRAARETFEIIANPCEMCDANAPYCAANKMHDEADKGMEDIDAALAALATTPAVPPPPAETGQYSASLCPACWRELATRDTRDNPGSATGRTLCWTGIGIDLSWTTKDCRDHARRVSAPVRGQEGNGNADE